MDTIVSFIAVKCVPRGVSLCEGQRWKKAVTPLAPSVQIFHSCVNLFVFAQVFLKGFCIFCAFSGSKLSQFFFSVDKKSLTKLY